jgi:hypothetical protein
MLKHVAKRIIHKVQSAFIGGRNIMSNILALHEILHETKRRGKIEIVLKLDFEKAYNKVHWGFLMGCLEQGGFGKRWCEWIKSVLYNGTVTVKQNGQVGPYFQSFKGVRQGVPYLLCFQFGH